MSKEIISKLLERNYPEYLHYTRIMEITGLSQGIVLRALRSLGKYENCEVKMIPGISKFKTLYRMKE